MRQIDRLRPLQMRVARDDHFPLPLAQPHQRALQEHDLPLQLRDLLPQPKPHIQRHLVVARAAGVQLGPRRHAARQRRLDVHVDIFQLRPATGTCPP